MQSKMDLLISKFNDNCCDNNHLVCRKIALNIKEDIDQGIKFDVTFLFLYVEYLCKNLIQTKNFYISSCINCKKTINPFFS